MNWLRMRTRLPVPSIAGPSISGPSAAGPAQDWSGVGWAAWADVETISRRVETEDISADRPEPLINLAREIVETVARQFHPRSKKPFLEIPVPHLLRIVELVAHDVRDACSRIFPVRTS